jgi:hypothetical protein
MSVSSAVGSFFGSIANFFKSVWSFLTNWFSAADRIQNRIDAFCVKVDSLVKNVEFEIDAWKSFEFNPHWSSRVINVPIAVDQIKEFVIDIPHEIIDKFKKARDDLRALFGLFEHGVPGAETQPMSGLDKVVSWMSLLDQSFAILEFMIDDLTVIEDDLRSIRETVEQLDVLFLQQGNSRKVVQKKSVIRIGNLH